MNKYIFPGADASCSLGWVVSQVEKAGFEVKNIDVFGVHYSATIWRWYKNWLAHKDDVIANYGERCVCSATLLLFLLINCWGAGGTASGCSSSRTRSSSHGKPTRP